MGQRKSNLLTYGRRLHDIGRVMVEAVYDAGGNDEDAERIFNDHLRRNLAQLIMGKPKLAGNPSDALASSFDLTVVEDVTPSEFKVSDLELVPNPEDGGRIGGETLRTRAVTLKANLGLMDAKYILDHQSEIPSEFRGSVLVFTGTLLRGSDGLLRVADLFWGDDCWRLNFCWFVFGFSGSDRLVRCKSSAL